MHSVQGLLKLQIRRAFVHALQNIYRHQRIEARAYRALADRHMDDLRRDVILIMADLADERARHYAVRLRRLGSASLPENENWSDRLWYWSLVHCSVGFAIRWIEWVEHEDTRELASLLHIQRVWH